ncbi:MAG: hypothetical protein M5R42_12685 [Rhodocyclaceae bacterium]|nr:hypothetical protein [Rhodocyclaceae bacterium]
MDRQQELALRQNHASCNTYLLLATILIPTAIGALFRRYSLIFAFMAAVMFLPALPGCCLGLHVGHPETKDSMGVVLLLGFTFLMGIMHGPIL